MTGLERHGIIGSSPLMPFEDLSADAAALGVAGRWWCGETPLATPPPPLVDIARRSLARGCPLRTRHSGETWNAAGIAAPGPALLLFRDPSVPRSVEELVSSAMRRTPLAEATAASPSLAQTAAILDRIATTRLPVLLLGETGTGKEVLARAFHRASGRPGPFVAENCGAIPEPLVESELFGVRRGAFTGALRDRRGRIREASRGTLFLDEIGDLPLPAQAKLLRVLQEGEVRSLGADRPDRVDLRVVAATHRDLARLVESGRFREDLYFRLAGFVTRVPPLRERKSDLPFLVAHLLARLRAEGSRVEGISEQALEDLALDRFQGNVRDLDNRLRRAAALAGGRLIESAVLAGEPPPPSMNLEERAIREALELSGGVKSEAARRLGWSRQKLYRRLARLGIDQPCRGSSTQSP